LTNLPKYGRFFIIIIGDTLISKEKALEVTEYCLTNGDEATLTAYNIPMETLNRYKREYKKHYGDSASLLMQLKQKYSEKELHELAKPDIIMSSWKNKILEFDGEDIVFGAFGDTHIGSQYTNEMYIKSAIEEFKKQKCQFIVHVGDVTEGMSGRDGHVYELSHIGYKAQKDAAINLLKEWNKKAYYIAGNHDLWYMSKGDTGADIVEDICASLPNAIYMGAQEGDININGVIIRLWHGGDGSSSTHSYRIQQILGSLDVQDIPEILLCGHSHKNGYFYDRGCHALTVGCLQNQSGFMRYKRLPAHVGFYIIRMKVEAGKLITFSPTYYPLSSYES